MALALNCLCGHKARMRFITCPCCQQGYHQRCLGIEQDLAAYWEKTGWRCVRCLARWHMEDALQKLFGLSACHTCAPNRSQASDPFSRAGTPVRFNGASPVAHRDERVVEWMRVLLGSLKRCSPNGVQELKALANLKQARHSILAQVVQQARADPGLLSDPGVGDAVHFIAILVWGARLLCQLRRMPALSELQALRQEMASLHVVNRPLDVMLTDLIRRTVQWTDTALPALREVCQQPVDVPVDLARLLPLLHEERGPPVRTPLGRRLWALLLDRGKRLCRCRGFYDGGLMLRCETCKEWFHSKCIQIRKQDHPEDEVYTCESCCHVEGRPYRWPPYQPPDLEAQLSETAELSDDEEADDEEDAEFNWYLEGIWPSMQHLDELDLHQAPPLPQAPALPPLTLPPSLERILTGHASINVPPRPMVCSLSTPRPFFRTRNASDRAHPWLGSCAFSLPHTEPMSTSPYGPSLHDALTETPSDQHHGMSMPNAPLVPTPVMRAQPWSRMQANATLPHPVLTPPGAYGHAREMPPWRASHDDDAADRSMLRKRACPCSHPNAVCL